jgi:phosphoribosylformylglycinamidine synthase PurS subunit
VIQRDRHAELLAALAITGASLEKFALEIRGLQKTEIGEVEEPFGKGQKGSSAMPHKRNPIGCEQITGWRACCAPTRTRRSRTWRCGTSATSRTRRSSASSCPTASSRSITCCGASRASCRGWWSIPTGCARTSSARAAWSSRARCCSSWRAAASRASRPTSGCSATPCGVPRAADFKALLLADADVMGVLTPAEIEKAFDLDDQLRNVDAIFDACSAARRRGPQPVCARVEDDMKARVFVTLKPSVFDPQGSHRRGAALARATPDVQDVRQGKYFELELEGRRRGRQAAGVVTEVADKLLANPVIESYRVEVLSVK